MRTVYTVTVTFLHSRNCTELGDNTAERRGCISIFKDEEIRIGQSDYQKNIYIPCRLASPSSIALGNVCPLASASRPAVAEAFLAGIGDGYLSPIATMDLQTAGPRETLVLRRRIEGVGVRVW